jgi:predicted nucleic acid-binding Zn ribbon protein
MVNTKKLKDAVKKSAEVLSKNAESVKKATVGKASSKFKEHKHCKICGKTISPLVEDLLCKSQACIDSFEKDLKVKKQLRFWMIVLVITLISPTLLQGMGII